MINDVFQYILHEQISLSFYYFFPLHVCCCSRKIFTSDWNTIVWTLWSINMIWQQTNVYPNAQKRKVRPFEGMIRKAIVIVPSDEDYKARIEAQEKEETKDVPDNAVMEMKGIAKDKLTFAVVILIFHELLRNFSKQFSSYIFILQIRSWLSYQTYIVIYIHKNRNEKILNYCKERTLIEYCMYEIVSQNHLKKLWNEF